MLVLALISPASTKGPSFICFEGKTSFGMSVFNLSNAIMGSGILGLAYAMRNTGITLFVILLICIALLSSYSIHLLLKCAGVVGIRAYEQLGLKAFGHGGKVVAAVIISIHNIGGKVSHFPSEVNYNVHGFIQLWCFIFSEWYMDGQILIVVVSVSVILPLALMKHLGYLGYTSGLSLTCMCFFLSSVSYVTPRNSEQKLNLLPIYTELRRPSKRRMQSVANVSILAMFSMYLLTAIFGYLTFYGNVEAEMLHTYIRVDPLDKLILCVRLAVLLAVTLTVPVVLFPIRRAIQQLLFPKKDFSWIRHVIIAFCLLFIVNLLVIFVPNIKDIFGVIGATSAPSLIFILPSIFYIRIIPNEKEPLRSRPKIQAACFAALGFIFMVMSLTFIIVDWVTTGKSSGVNH
uniref:Solute carrier family 38 member 5 n=1 Tax=Naja naja TaxID=35670 RepID=A0A8C6XKB0_NAJNA